MNGKCILAARLAALTLVAGCALAQTRTAPVIVGVAENPGRLDIYWYHDRLEVDRYHVWREDLTYPIPFLRNAILHHYDLNLPPDTSFRYRVCAVYDGDEVCGEQFNLRTSVPPVPVPAQSRPPPEMISSVVYDNPLRIQVRWRKKGDYERVIVRWYLKSNPVPSQVDHDGPSDGFHEASAPIPGVYVFQFKGCMLNILNDTRCGGWSQPYEVDTRINEVAQVSCQPGIIKGTPQFSADGRAVYQFHNPPPGRNDYVGRCLDPRGEVMAFYLTDGTWNPNVRAGASDRSGANATESFKFTVYNRLSPDRSPRRPEGQSATIHFLLRAKCDRDPWLHAGAVCRRTGDNVPPDIRAKWPALMTEPFPHTRSSIAAGDRAGLIARYRMVTDRVEGRAEPTVDSDYLQPVNPDVIQGQAPNTPGAAAASRPQQTTRGVAQTQSNESQLVPARPAAGSTVLQRQTPAVLANSSATTRNSSPALDPVPPANSRAVQAASQASLVLICRGGPLMGWTTYVEEGSGRRMTSLVFQPQSQTSLIDARGAGLRPSECGFPTQAGYVPPNVRFESGNVDVRALLTDEGNYYSFDVVQKHGYFESAAHRALQSTSAPAASRASSVSQARTLEVTRPAVSNTDGYTTREEDGRSLATPGRRIQGVSSNAGRATALEMDCVRNGPRISNLHGRITSGRSFTINGSCFGAQAGEVQLIGEFTGGTLRPAFTQWSESAIVVQMPALSDVASHVIAVSVRRQPDGKMSAATRAQYAAAMREVEIPPTAWSPSGQFSFENEETRLGGAVGDQKDYSRIAERKSTGFRLAVNAACELQTLAVPATVGGVHAINGWEAGPVNEATVEVIWTPVCKLETIAGIPGVTRERRKCSGAFVLEARASCPVGVAPL